VRRFEIMRRLGIASFCLAAVTLSATAAAHVRFVSPTPRYPSPTGFDNGMNIKTGPCGRANDSRTTDESRVTEFEAGETITVQFNETIDHPGFFRISFDDDGQDAFDPPPLSRDDVPANPMLPILKDDIADKNGGMYEVDVTLPDVECDNCTLQLIQVMVDADSWPVSEIYFTCADIKLTRANGTGGMGGMGMGGANGGAGAGGTSAGNGGAAPGAGGASAGGGGVAAASGSGGVGNAGGTGGLAAGGNATGGNATGGNATAGNATGGTAGSSMGGTTTTAGRSGGGAPGTAGSTGGSLPTAGNGTAPSEPDEEAGGCSIGGVYAPRTSSAVVALLGAALIAFGARRKRD
jgi:hypothetical protein